MKNATFPHCPLGDCVGKFVTKTSTRGRQYRQCDTCGAFDGARFLTAAERAQLKRDKAARQARKSAAQKREAERQAQRQRELETPQLPVKGWSPREWFPGYVGDGEQLGFEF